MEGGVKFYLRHSVSLCIGAHKSLEPGTWNWGIGAASSEPEASQTSGTLALIRPGQGKREGGGRAVGLHQ